MAERAGQVNGQFVRTYFKKPHGDVRGGFVLEASRAAGISIAAASYVWDRCLLQASMQPICDTGSIDGLDVDQIASDCGCTAERVQTALNCFCKAGKFDWRGDVAGWHKTNLSRDEFAMLIEETQKRLNRMSPLKTRALMKRTRSAALWLLQREHARASEKQASLNASASKG